MAKALTLVKVPQNGQGCRQQMFSRISPPRLRHGERLVKELAN
jgi:hypothetical protein